MGAPAPVKSCESVTTGRSHLFKRTAIACGSIALLVGTLAAWRVRERRELLSNLQRRIAAQGASLHVETTLSLFGDSVRSARLELGSEVSIATDRATIRQSPFAAAEVAVDNAQFALRGSPATLWDQWTKTNAWRDLPVTFTNSRVDYEDASVGHLSLAGTRLEHRAEELVVRATQLAFNGQHWNDVTLAISHPKTVVRIGLGEAAPTAPQLEVRYVPSLGKAAEWMLNVPSQPLGSLLGRLGAGVATPADSSRVAGTLSAIVFDDATTPSRANVALVVDNWFVPAWPQASALTGKSGSIGARLSPSGDGRSWKLTRVEVGAAIFSLTGTGTLTLGEPSRLSFEVNGARSCAQLAAHLPVSTYREKAMSFLERAKQATGAASREPPDAVMTAEEQTVRLRLSVELTMGVRGHSNFTWHLTAGCGLDELKGQGTFGGS